MQAIPGLWDSGFLAVSHGAPNSPIRSQDLGRYAVLEHAWAVGVAIAFVRIFSVTALMYNEILSGRGLLGLVR